MAMGYDYKLLELVTMEPVVMELKVILIDIDLWVIP